MSSFQQKFYEKCKETGKYDQCTIKVQATEIVCEKDQISEITEKAFKVAIINMLKKTMIQQLKEGMMIMY